MQKGWKGKYMVEAQKGLVMYYVQEEHKRMQIEVLCIRVGLQTKYLKASDINEPIGKLAEIRGLKLPEAPQEKAPIVFAVPEILIFSGLSNKQLDEFLAAYKAAGLEKIELKAVLTSQNIRWTLYQLIQEIRKEREKIEVPAK